jgi:ADP-ribose pyrophosphatase
VKAPGVGVAAIVVDHGRVLVVLRGRSPAAGLWAFPGGRLELGERLRAAARREVREECDLDVEVRGLVEVVEAIEQQGAMTHHWVLAIYLARPVGGSLRPGDDAVDARWATPDDLRRLPVAPQVPELAERALAMAARARAG